MAGPYDVLVAGSGAAGLTTALVCAVSGLRTVVCESSAWLGGTSAVSGGRVWVPGNRFQPDPDADRQEAARYLAGLFPGQQQMIDAFLASAPAMAAFVAERSAHRFAQCPAYPDYHPGRPGAALGGRSLDAEPLALAPLHPLTGRVACGRGQLPLTHAEWERWRHPHRYDWDLLRWRQAERIAAGGAALVSALLDGVLRAGGRVVTGHRLTDLTASDGGGFEAVLATEATGRVTVPAAAVVLATGGYDQDPLLRARHLPPAITASASAPGNVGDALRICGRLGVSLQNLGQGWWMPMVSIPGSEPGEAPGWHALIRERGLPRVIIVDRGGRRFANEAAPYHELGKALIRAAGTAPATRPPAYLIFDEGYRTRYSVPGAGPLPAAPGWLVRAATVTGLAAVLGIDPAGLGDQVTRWNAACAAGTDREFGRGRSAYDRYYGDPEQAGNPSLGPLGQPPYYGMPVHAGTIGSKGGPVTDPDGRILGPAGAPIPGIYAAGNSAASWTADGYPGPGATLGIGMTLGYRAACAIIRAARPLAAG